MISGARSRRRGRARRRDPLIVVVEEEAGSANVMTIALSEAGLRVEVQQLEEEGIAAAGSAAGGAAGPPQAGRRAVRNRPVRASAPRSGGERPSDPATSSDGSRRGATPRHDFTKADLLIVNADSPRARGVLHSLLALDARPPLMLVSREGAVHAVAQALDAGAEDYLVKPVHPDELAARVRAVLRRTMPPPSLGCIDLGGVLVDLDRRIATRDGERIPLSRVEWLLLEQLALEPGTVVRHETLLAEVWGVDPREQGHWLRIWIGRLRRRLGWKARGDGAIVTVPGVGYRLDAGRIAAAGGQRGMRSHPRHG